MKNTRRHIFALSSSLFIAASLSSAALAGASDSVSRLACDMTMQKAFVDARDQNLASVQSKNDYESFHHSISAGLAEKISGIVKDFTAKNPGTIDDSKLSALDQSLALAMAPYKATDTMPYISFCPPKSTPDGVACRANPDWSDGGVTADGHVEGYLMRTPYFTNDPQRGIVLNLPGWILDYKQVALSDLNADGMYKALFGDKPAAPKSIADLKQDAISNLQSDCQSYKADIAGIANAAMNGSKTVQEPSSSRSLVQSAGQSHTSQMTGSGSGR